MERIRRRARAHEEPAFGLSGLCNVCGYLGPDFGPPQWPNVANFLGCPRCHSALRFQLQAQALVHLFSRHGANCLADLCDEPEFQRLAIYEPGITGSLRPFLSPLPRYQDSYYWEDVPQGELKDGVRSEDLQRLTFADESFDLVLTSDVFEHVRRPLDGFAEVFRVLKRGAFHVFTVPLGNLVPVRAASIDARVDTSGPDDIDLLPREYHGSPTDPDGVLVYTDFGSDLVATLDAMGYRTRLVRGIGNAHVFVAGRPT